jgi:hypothetical protein
MHDANKMAVQNCKSSLKHDINVDMTITDPC